MKRAFYVFSVLLLILPGFFCPVSASKLHISLEPFVSLGNAGLQECVLYGTLLNEDAGKKKSCLDWNANYLTRTGFSCYADYSFLNLSGDFSVYLPWCHGILSDFDWRNTPGVMTDYSYHDVKKASGIAAEAALGCNLSFFSDALRLIPFAGVGYRELHLTGYDGYGYYSDLKWKEFAYSGKVVEYTQSVAMVRTGLRIEADFADTVSLRLSGEWSPYLECLCHDEHISNGHKYKDFFTGKGAMAFSGIIGVKAFSTGQICFGLNFQLMPTVDGLPESGFNYMSYPGTSYSIWEASLSYRIRIV